MRSPAPPIYRPAFLERFGLARLLPPLMRMIVRNVERTPIPSSFTVIAVAFATAILIVGRYGLDSIEYMMDLQFRLAQSEDVTVTFVRPLSNRARFELRALPGVREVETFRTVPARLFSGPRSRRVALLGLTVGSPLARIFDARLRRVEIPPEGMLMSRKLAELLDVRTGQAVQARILERGMTRSIPLTAIVDDVLGLNVYLRDTELHRLLDEDRTISGAYLTLDRSQTAEFDRRIKGLPAVSGVAYRASMMEQFQQTISSSMGISIAFLIGFAAAIACGVIYNAGRMALAERSRELSTLRILGFSRAETAGILLGEAAAVTALAIPAGCLLGYALCRILEPVYETEVYRLPAVVQPTTYAFATVTVTLAAIVSGAIVRHRLDRLDTIAALKAAE
jgi:putative ABC transport system permease protein